MEWTSSGLGCVSLQYRLVGYVINTEFVRTVVGFLSLCLPGIFFLFRFFFLARDVLPRARPQTFSPSPGRILYMSRPSVCSVTFPSSTEKQNPLDHLRAHSCLI
jgi:hypothetical protein